ncbi:hypothetical protein [Segetibacter aerophilus]|uniref:hypothetical protein n=1 Tax=Segetibacter aerophilus TaxID=670293 RepID=UPI0011BE9783|nr:hypothetical protein [Segetibacter aerophilus]
MNTTILLRPLAVVGGMLLIFPSVYFVISSWLNDAFNTPALWKIIEPIFKNQEFDFVGWNRDVIMLLGPLLAILINLPQVVHLHLKKDNQQLHVNLVLLRNVYCWLIIASATWCLTVIDFTYSRIASAEFSTTSLPYSNY